jgi:hypothetical protein
MRIAIDIHGVLRDTNEKIKQVYEKYLIDEQELDENKEFTYEMNLPVNTTNLLNHFSFPSEDDFFIFMYEDFVMQIFGHSPSTEMSTFQDLDETYHSFKEDFKFILISNEVGKSKPATLFFISKFGCQIDKIIFYNKLTENTIWDEFDILLTSNPELLLQNNNKIIIKYTTEYNESIDTEYTINTIKELPSLLTKIKNNNV